VSSALFRYVPALDSLRRYSAADLRGDLVGGLSVAAVAVPQAMAYAMIAGLPAEYGLYTAIVMTTVGALLDSSRQLINGPTNAISIALLGAIGMVETTDEKVAAAGLLALLIGLVQIAISLARLGDLTRYISHSVIVGFTAGASLLLVLDQLKNLLGQKAMGDVHDHFLLRVFRSLTEGGPIHGPTLAVGLGSMAAVLLLRWFKARIGWHLLPEFLLVVMVAAAVSAWLGLEARGVRVVGDIPGGLPTPRLPAFDLPLLQSLAPSALAIGLLGLLEAIAMSKSIAAITRQRLDLNQQCLSEGCANFTASFFGCMPGSGSLTRSAINQQAGARTQWSGVISAVAVAAIMLVFAPYAGFIPRAALAGLLMLTAARMVNLGDLRYHMRASRFDAVIVATTAIAAFAISIEFCVLIGVIMSFLLAVPRTSSLHLTEFIVTDEGAVHERLPEDEPCPKILIFGLEGELFFGSAASIDTHVETLLARVKPETKVVILRMKRTRNPDAVGLAALDHLVTQMKERGVVTLLCGVRDETWAAMGRSGLLRRMGPGEVFREERVRQTSTLLAIRHAYTLIGETCPACPRTGGPLGRLHYVV
jgi:SulP family sulfate permease